MELRLMAELALVTVVLVLIFLETLRCRMLRLLANPLLFPVLRKLRQPISFRMLVLLVGLLEVRSSLRRRLPFLLFSTTLTRNPPVRCPSWTRLRAW